MGVMGWQEVLVIWFLAAPIVALVVAIGTSGRSYPDSYIDQVVDGLTTATPARRLGGAMIDGIIAVCTLGIGWLIWLAIVAPRGQSPGKAIVSTYVVTKDGQVAGAGTVWAREILVKGILFGLLNLVSFNLASFVGAMWCLWDPNKQCLWDKVVGTGVGYGRSVPQSVNMNTSLAAEELRELKRLRDDGIITENEYDVRRDRAVQRL